MVRRTSEPQTATHGSALYRRNNWLSRTEHPCRFAIELSGLCIKLLLAPRCAGGKVGSGTEMFADVGLVTCVAISSAVLIFYCVTGGIIASVYTDVVQGTIMIVAGALILIAATNVFDGGRCC